MTPMQSLKNQFDFFKNLLPPIFQEIALNHSEDKTYVSHWCGDSITYNMKGVRSDFIKLFQAKFNTHESYSIGFSFHYINISKEQQTIQVSIKKGHQEPLYFLSEHLSIEEFRKQFIITLEQIAKEEDKNYAKIIQIMQENFHLKPQYNLQHKKRFKKK